MKEWNEYYLSSSPAVTRIMLTLMLTLQLTLTHKRKLSLALEEFEHKYLFIELIKGTEFMTPEYFSLQTSCIMSSNF